VSAGPDLFNLEPFTIASLAGTGQGENINPKQGILLAALTASTTTAIKIAMLGSSTTVGNNASDAAHRYVNLLADAFRTEYGSGGATAALDGSASPTTAGVHVRNGGVGSTTAANYVNGTRHGYITTLQPQIVTHMIGSNDYGTNVNPATYKTNVQTVIDDIDAEVTGPVLHILINAYQRTDVTGSYAFALYGEKLAEIAAANDNVTYVDLNPSYIARGWPGADPDNLIDTDNLHQTDAGHAFMARLLFDALVGGPETGGGGPPTTGSIVSWVWTQTAGPTVALVGTGSDRQYITPGTRTGTSMTFQLTATGAAGGVSTDTVTHTVLSHGGPFMYVSGALVGVAVNRPTI
jgi:lysophospholipase L1-like esterase